MAHLKQKAAVVGTDGGVTLGEVDVQKPGPGEILVKIVAAAQNPIDLKLIHANQTGSVLGCDFAGVVEEIGPAVPEGLRTIGERVAGFVLGDVSGPSGAFTEYVVATADLVIHIPDDWSFEEGAQLGIVAYTTCQVLYQTHSFPTPLDEPLPASTAPTLLVTGGASSVGLYVIQFAALAGLRVITTARPASFDLVKAYGADAVVDYTAPDAPAQIRALVGGPLLHIVDCIGEYGTPELVAAVVADAGTLVATTVPYATPLKSAGTTVTFALSFHLLGKPIQFPFPGPRDEALAELGKKYTKLIEAVVATGKIKPNPVLVIPSGLAGVSEGFKYAAEGKVRGQKVTYRIAETP
ncbi:GroES-like protein [Auriscalpium vulgare]|uniref:GroES-like protein n=1 Tax=Auriscalpium vulgare TaxID=40419 RepID=A0ACB8RGJ9_9AGAM|nr:GroES-like protein [Auriscalpium vulgare]